MPPETLGRYQVLDEIGDGAMGRVYRGFDPLVRRVVAIKIVKPELLAGAAAGEYARRFRREAQAAGVLSHPAIVGIYDVGDDYLVMEYLEGVTLQRVLEQRGRLEVAEALQLLAPVADALDHAHRGGIVHRDVKPANIMVLPDGRPKLMGFGAARLDSTVMTATGQLPGSPSYMAPEQVAEGQATARSDLFSLAVVAYEALTGERPFQGETITSIISRVVNAEPPPPRQLNLALPEGYDAIFRRALAKSPDARFPSASTFVAALEKKELDSAIDRPLPDPAPPTPDAASASPLAGTTRQAPAQTVAAGRGAVRAAGVALKLPRAATASALGLGLGLAALAASAALWRGWQRTESLASAPRSGGLRLETEPPGARVAALREGDLVEAGPGITPPRKLAGEAPIYPGSARRMHLVGTVVVEMIVDEHGAPRELRVLQSAGEVLDAAVVDALRGWRFEPARAGDVKLKLRHQVRFTFQQ
jgi:serine/threonine-protein kinase